MVQDWLELTRLTAGAPVVIERVKLADKDIHIEGEFELPPLARLSTEDQVFIMAFVKSDGSIKELEKSFGISYPTVKNRLARIAAQFEFAETRRQPGRQVDPLTQPFVASSADSPAVNIAGGGAAWKDETIEKLRRGEITAAEAIARLMK